MLVVMTLLAAWLAWLLLSLIGRRPWERLWDSDATTFVVWSALRPALASAALASTFLFVLLGSFALVVPGQYSESGSASRGYAFSVAATVLLFTFPLFWAVVRLSTEQAALAVFHHRPELLCMSWAAARLQVRSPAKPPVTTSTWERFWATESPRDVWLDPDLRPTPRPRTLETAYSQHRQGRIARRARADRIAALILATAGLSYLMLLLVRATSHALSEWGVHAPTLQLSNQAEWLVAGFVLLVISSAIWATGRRLRRGTGRRSLAKALGVVPDWPPAEVRVEGHSTGSRSDAADEVLRQMAYQLDSASAAPGLSWILQNSTTVDVQLRTLNGQPSWLGTIVTEPKAPSYVPGHVRLASTRLPRPMATSAIAVAPRAHAELSSEGPGVELDAFERRFTVLTDNDTWGHAVVAPRLVEYLQTLPDGVAVIFAGEWVVVMTTFPAGSDFDGSLESVALALAALTPSFPGWAP